MRVFFFVLIIVWPGLVAAQPPSVPVFRLTLRLALPPVESSRYELLPAMHERDSGNAALRYHLAMLIFSEAVAAEPFKDREEQSQKIDEMLSRPAQQSDLPELSNYLRRDEKVLRDLDIGAAREHCDWDLQRRIAEDGIATLLPEVQKMRELARLLSIRCRVHQLQGKVADALHDVQVGFVMARHVGEQPTFISSLVGIAISSIFAGQLDHILEMPNCPNLYWARLRRFPARLLTCEKQWRARLV